MFGFKPKTLAFFLIFLLFVHFMFFTVKHKKAYFYKHLECAAPKCGLNIYNTHPFQLMGYPLSP